MVSFMSAAAWRPSVRRQSSGDAALPIQKAWNNVSDCHERVVTPPVREDQLRDLGFPAEGIDALRDPLEYVTASCRVLSRYANLAEFVLREARVGTVALVKETSEHVDLETGKSERYFLSFGSKEENGVFEYPVSFELGLGLPNWRQVESAVGFMPAPEFIDFVESFPGLSFNHICYSQFILPHQEFSNVEDSLPQDGYGNLVVGDEQVRFMKRFLLFQHSYSGALRILGGDGCVHEVIAYPFSLRSTGKSFGSWVQERLVNWSPSGPNPDA